MSNLTEGIVIQPVGSGGVDTLYLTVGAAKVYKGGLAAQLDADGTAVAASTASSGDAIGVFQHDAEIGATVAVETNRVYRFTNGTSTDACSSATPIGASVYCGDDHTIYDNDASGTLVKAGIFEGLDADGKVLLRVHPFRVLATTNAVDIDIADAGTFTAQTTVEGALQEIYQSLLTAQKSIGFSLHQFREVDSNGDVGNASANGGILASDTTPIMRGDAAETSEIFWAASNSDPISTQVTLPTDFDGTANATLDLWVYSGSTDAATFTVETGWDGGALVSDSADDSGTKSATLHKITATIAAGDIPNTAALLTIALTPGAHTTNGIGLLGARLNYKAKLLTS